MFGSPETVGHPSESAAVGPPGPFGSKPRVHLWARCHEKEKYSGSDTGTGREVMGATFGPSRAIAVLLAAAMALVGLSFVGSPAAVDGAVSFLFSSAGVLGSGTAFGKVRSQLN